MFSARINVTSILLVLCILPVWAPVHAQCTVVGTTAGGGDEVECTGADNDGFDGTANPDSLTIQPGASISRSGANVISLMDGNDQIVMNGGTVTRTDGGNGLSGDGDNDTFNINGGVINATFAINGAGGDDVVNITGGTLNGEINLSSDNDMLTMSHGAIVSERDAINASSGNDVVTITGGTVIAGTDGSGTGINGSSGADTISISTAILTGGASSDAINASSGDDEITYGTGAVINGELNCGDDFDTLTFAMFVPPEQFAAAGNAIAGANPAGDSVTINGLTYTWRDCELLVDDLQTTGGDYQIGAEMSASFYDQDFEGSGINTEILALPAAGKDGEKGAPGLVVIYWYSYDIAGFPIFAFGVGEFAGHTMTVDMLIDYDGFGPVFGPAWDPADFEGLPFATVQIVWFNCGNGVMTFELDSSFLTLGWMEYVMNLERITNLVGIPCI